MHCAIDAHLVSGYKVTLDWLSYGRIANEKNVLVIRYLNSANLIIRWVQIASGKKSHRVEKMSSLARCRFWEATEMREHFYFQFF